MMPFEEVRARHVVLRDGTRGGSLLARAVVLAFGVAVLLVVAWKRFPGATDVMANAAGESVGVPQLAVRSGLLVVAVLFALLAWHSAGARTWRPLLAIIGVAFVDVLLAMALLDRADIARTLAPVVPSFSSIALETADDLVRWATVALLATALFVAVALMRGRTTRVVAALAAAVAPCAVVFAHLGVGSTQNAGFTDVQLAEDGTVSSVAIEVRSAAGELVTSVLQLAGLVALAAFGLLAALGVRELMKEKTESGTQALRAGVPRSRVTVLGIGALALLLFLLGRADVLPGGKEAIPALTKTGVESWILAGVFAVSALLVLRACEERPLQRRGVLLPLVGVGLTLTFGHVVLALSRMLQLIVGPLTDRGSFHDWVFTDLPTWSLWAQDWSFAVVPVAAGVIGVALMMRGERSDRTAFLLATAVISVVPGMLIVFDHRGIDAGLRHFSPATPDQVMIVAVFLVSLAAVIGVPILRTSRTLRLQIGVLLVTFVAALVSSAVGGRLFHLGLVMPFVAPLLLSGRHLRPKPSRGAYATAVAAGLLVMTAGGLMSGLLGRQQFDVSDTISFLVLSGPLLLVELARRSGEEPDEELVPTRRAPTWAALVVALVIASLAVAAPRAMTAEPGGRRYPVNVVLHDGWSARQIMVGGGAEHVLLNHGSTEVQVVNVATSALGCTIDVLSTITREVLDGTLTDIDPLAGMPAVSGQLAQGRVACASSAVEGSTRLLIVVADTDPTDEMRVQLDDISFGD